MRRRSDAAATTTDAGGVNRCPDCGAPQFHAPGSGWTCCNGHGYGEPNGPAANAAPTPPEYLDAAPTPPEYLDAAPPARCAEVADALHRADAARRARADSADPDIESVTVTWGKEGFSPVQFHVFEVGPYTATTRLRPGETVEQAVLRVRAKLQRIADADFAEKLPAYLERVRRAADGARAMKGGR